MHRFYVHNLQKSSKSYFKKIKTQKSLHLKQKSKFK